MQVELSFQNTTETAAETTIWQSWITTWLTQLNPCDPDDGLPLHPQHHYELALRLTDDHEIQALNQQFRAKDQPTDVLSFAALEGESFSLEGDDAPLYLGDIVVSVETAQRQASEQGHDLTTELAWLASHGLLHLLGWDHPDDVQLAAMLAQQRSLLQTAGIIA
ncbi:rRNA maturation RNase YbeY [filamentous cyanobacterium LEGE 11480]|uniref:Endoribonuclease YbeY n=1 Tax=Romeriopsis navalis LEGE 11480 TaxID=2777977 RepID=A0A928VQ96_9CYAN|nr:rRNA maturation RNase YbeY [Romeriopsis navalis]MBE9032520.1 rRNA maturation RNase YbeY [Romeriopsis navalis LEGE 11480]